MYGLLGCGLFARVRQNTGVEILVNGQLTLACKVFNFDSAFHDLVVFFHRPPIMIQVSKKVMGILFHICQRSDEYLCFAGFEFDTNKA